MRFWWKANIEQFCNPIPHLPKSLARKYQQLHLRGIIEIDSAEGPGSTAANMKIGQAAITLPAECTKNGQTQSGRTHHLYDRPYYKKCELDVHGPQDRPAGLPGEVEQPIIN